MYPFCITLHLRTSSLRGSDVNFSMGSGRVCPFTTSAKPLVISLLATSPIGAFIFISPVGSRFLFFILGWASANRFINTPRNFADSSLVLVMSVFSSDRVSFSSRRNSWISCLRETTTLFGPHTPIIQSSAYLTYSILTNFGFGLVDFTFLR